MVRRQSRHIQPKKELASRQTSSWRIYVKDGAMLPYKPFKP